MLTPGEEGGGFVGNVVNYSSKDTASRLRKPERSERF